MCWFAEQKPKLDFQSLSFLICLTCKSKCKTWCSCFRDFPICTHKIKNAIFVSFIWGGLWPSSILLGPKSKAWPAQEKNRRAKQNPWEFPRMMKFCLSARIPALSEKFCGQRTFCSGLWKAMRAFITQHDYLILNHHGRSCNNFVIWLKLNVQNSIAGLSFPRAGQFVRMGFLPHRLTFNS